MKDIYGKLGRKHIKHILDYWLYWQHFQNNAFSSIDWEVPAQANQDESPSFCRWATKHTMGMCGVGKWRL
jgi:hypothetical protein